MKSLTNLWVANCSIRELLAIWIACLFGRSKAELAPFDVLSSTKPTSETSIKVSDLIKIMTFGGVERLNPAKKVWLTYFLKTFETRPISSHSLFSCLFRLNLEWCCLEWRNWLRLQSIPYYSTVIVDYIPSINPILCLNYQFSISSSWWTKTHPIDIP